MDPAELVVAAVVPENRSMFEDWTTVTIPDSPAYRFLQGDEQPYRAMMTWESGPGGVEERIARFRALLASIQRTGQERPIEVVQRPDSKLVVVNGNHRAAIALHLGVGVLADVISTDEPWCRIRTNAMLTRRHRRDVAPIRWKVVGLGGVDVYEERVAVLASGPSAAGITDADLDGLPVIAVNHAIERVDARYWITVNPERTDKLMARQANGTRYFAGMPEDLDAHPGVTRLRRYAEPGLSENPGAIYSGNSAYAGKGLAYLMGAQKIALLGVDGGDKDGFHVDRWGRKKSLEHLPDLFRSAVPQLDARGVEVVNGSPHSRVTCFPRMSPQEAIAWLRT